MAASAATSGYSTVLQDNSSGSYVSVAEVVRITGPKVSRKFIDVSNLTSPSEAEEFIAGFISNGMVTMDVNYLPGNATQKNIVASIQNGTKWGFKLILSDAAATTISWNGFYAEFEPTAPHDNKLSARIAIKVTGLVTIPT